MNGCIEDISYIGPRLKNIYQIMVILVIYFRSSSCVSLTLIFELICDPFSPNGQNVDIGPIGSTVSETKTGLV